MKTSFRIGTIIGIPIKIHFTFIFILALFAFAFSIDTISIFNFKIGFGGLPISNLSQIVLGGLVAIILFICVLLHELGHSYVTQKMGYKINSITLFIFGGISNSEEIPREPKLEMKIAIAGPAVSIAIGIIFYLLLLIIQTNNINLISNIISITTGTLAFYNLLLAGFNLIPAFPIDGGRILRAGFALKMDYRKATKYAARIGKAVAVAMAIIGIIYNFWLILIAIFIFFGASQEEKKLKISDALKDKKVKDLMEKDFETVPPDINIKELYEIMKEKKFISYPVLKDGKIIGLVSIDNVKKLDKNNWNGYIVEDIMQKNISTVSPDEDAFSVFKNLMKQKMDRVLVKESGDVIGILSVRDLFRNIRISELKK